MEAIKNITDQKRKFMWGISNEFWVSFAYYALGTGFLLGALALVATSLSAYVSYKVADSLQEENKKSISEAHSKIEEAKRDAALANERAAGLEKEAAVARLAQEKLRTQIAWRWINKSQFDKLIALLRERPMKVTIGYPVGDAEAASFADEISEIFKQAGSTPELSARVWMPTAPMGLGINQTANGDSAFLMNAFGSVGLPLWQHDKAENVDIIVGTKPKSFFDPIKTEKLELTGTKPKSLFGPVK